MAEVATREQMMVVADKVAAQDPNLMDADLNDWTPDIREALQAIGEGADLDETKVELDNLYTEWESEGFPIDDPDEDGDDWVEGSDDTDDPDAFPDPENEPLNG